MQAAGLVLTSYQDSLSRALDIVSNNVANVNTSGYKRENVAFESYLVRPAANQTYNFAVEKGTYRDTAAGPTLMTGNPLDVAIQGKGYFPVQTPAGIRYTRAGSFQLNSDGEIVTAAGYKVLGDGDQAITLPSDARDVLIGSDGTVSAKTGTGSGVTQMGKLRAVKFEKEQALQATGDSLFASSETPQSDPDSRIVQGAVEQSNVQSVTEMTRMIEISRTYQQVVRMLDIEYQRQTTAIQRLGKLTA